MHCGMEGLVSLSRQDVARQAREGGREKGREDARRSGRRTAGRRGRVSADSTARLELEEQVRAHMVVGALDAVVAQAAVARPRRPVRLARLAPCGPVRLGESALRSPGRTRCSRLRRDSRSATRLESARRRAGDAHLLATTPPSLTRIHLASTCHSPSLAEPSPPPEVDRRTHLRGGDGSRLRGRMPGSEKAVLSCTRRTARVSLGHHRSLVLDEL